ncbi:MAG: hypothetical protein F6K11_06415 [Leptolyngbya sp. SIO3F4]|nr:hypothetical protein [Leptolyngbya sp. SIO3F4]
MAPPPVQQPPIGARKPSSAVAIWQEKLEFLREEEVLASGAQKFALKKQIQEAEQKIQELGG